MLVHRQQFLLGFLNCEFFKGIHIGGLRTLTLSSIAHTSAEVLSSSPQYINLLTLSPGGSVAAAGTYRLHCQYLHTTHGGLNRMGIRGLLIYSIYLLSKDKVWYIKHCQIFVLFNPDE